MPGGESVGLQYLTRRLLSLLELQYGPEVWDPLSMAQLQELAPDANRHCRELGEWGCERARLHFGMSPLYISSAASIWGTVDEDHGTYLLSVKPTEIFNSIRALHRTESALSHDGSSVQLSWWPSMRELSRVAVSANQPAEA